MTADPPDTDDSAVGSRLDAVEGDATAEHLAVYTAIASDLAARLDAPTDEPKPYPSPAPLAGSGEHGGARG